MNDNVSGLSLGDELSPMVSFHIECPDWRDRHLMEMGEWHPLFNEIELPLQSASESFKPLLKKYSEILLTESTDEPDWLLCHLQEEVCPYIQNTLHRLVTEVWHEVMEARK